MFGELVGAWAAQVWADHGRPDPFVLAELGPGRGTLMRDALRAAAAMPGFAAAARLGSSRPARRCGRGRPQTLAGARRRPGPSRSAALPAGRRSSSPTSSSTRCRSASSSGSTRSGASGWSGLERGRLARVWGPPRPDAGLDGASRWSRDGAVVEVSPAGEAVAAGLGARIARRGGAALIVDYGARDGHRRHAAGAEAARAGRSAGGAGRGRPDGARRLRARWRRRRGRRGPGARCRRGCSSSGSGSPRGRRRWRAAGGAAAEAVAAAHRRLTHPEEMGNLLRVLALTPDDAPPPPGLDA